MIPEPRTFVALDEGLPGRRDVRSSAIDQPEDRSFAVPVEPDRLKTLKIFVRQPRDLRRAGPSQSFSFVVEDKSSSEADRYTATFNAPENTQ